MFPTKPFPENSTRKRFISEISPADGLTKKPRCAVTGITAQMLSAMSHSSIPGQPFAVLTPRFTQRAPVNNARPYFQNKLRVQVAGPQFPTPVNQRVVKQNREPKLNQNQCIFSGTVKKILEWQSLRVSSAVPCLFEVWGQLDYVRTGPIPFLKTFMLRDNDSGPVIKVMFYEMDRALPALNPGQTVSVVGVLKERSCLQAYQVSKVTEKDLALSQHIIFICDIAAKNAANA